jgi:hypothetical protein
MNMPGVGDSSLWIIKGTECTLSGGLVSPYFIPKVSGITMEYDSVLSSSFSMSLYMLILICFLIHIFCVVNINGKLLIPCGIRVEARVGTKDNETYEVLEVLEQSTEDRAVVAWPAKFENEKDVEWFVRVLYGVEFKKVYVYFCCVCFLFYF